MIGRYNKIDEYADRLSYRIKVEFKKSMNDAILIIPSDMCIDNLIDASGMESKNKMKEIRQTALKERHVGLAGISTIRLGHNTYNDMYLVTEYDNKRIANLLDILYKRGINFKQVVSPLYASHHLARTVTCPFEVISKGSASNIVKAGSIIINISINRITYVFVHNNLPIEIRESSNTFMPFIERMEKVGVPFTKVTRILRLIGVDGIDEEVEEYDEGNSESYDDQYMILDSLDSLEDEPGGSSNLENDEGNGSTNGDSSNSDKEQSKSDNNNYLIRDDSLTTKSGKVKKSPRSSMLSSLKSLNDTVHSDDTKEDEDISLTDEQYQLFEQALVDELVTLRAEAQKNLTYFTTAHGVKIANIIATSNDINGLGRKLSEYLEIDSGTLSMEPGALIEIDDYTISNETGEQVDCSSSLGLGAILSNFVRGDIYE
jgi:hypothetical protein